MFCKKCGTLLADTSKFCPKCGTSVSSVNPMKTVANQTSPDKTLLFRMNKKHIITISIILSLLITCVSLLAIFVFPHADIYAFQYQIKTGDYQQAYLTYDNLEYEELSKVNVWMKEYASSVEEEYYNGQTDYNTAIQIISSICRYDIKTVYEIKNNILLDNESNILFNQGKAYAEDSQWKEAYLTLQEIDTDYRLYNEVTPLLTDYASNFRSDVLSKMTNLSNNDEIDEMKSIRDNALIVIPDDAEIQNGYKDQLNAFIDRKISEASALADQGNYDKAIELLDNAQFIYETEKFKVAISEIEYRRAEEHCEALAAQNDLLGAVKYAKRMASANSNTYSKLVYQYATLLVDETLQKAEEYVKNGQYSEASKLIASVRAVYDHQKLREAAEKYNLSTAEAHCEELASQNDLLGAVKYAKELADMDSSYCDLLNKYAAPLVEETLDTARAFASERQYEKAINAIEKVQKIYNCKQFANTIEEYSQYTPRKLSDCHLVDSDSVYLDITAQDCFGTEYEQAIGFNESYSSYEGGFAVFYLDGDFVSLDGCFVGSSDLYKNMEVSCAIYADGNLIFESPKLGRTSKPVNISLDITDVDQLRIEYTHYTWWTNDICCIFDLTVS